MYKITNANIKEWAANYDGELFDGILCDPPYELGFMGKSWDSSGIAFDTEMWADLFKLVKPGGHLLAFSGSRTYHRMAVAIEDAGFEIRDMIEWVYGSGFPKSLNVGKAVDKIQGNEREVTGTQEREGRSSGILGKKVQITRELSTGTSPYEGYGTALKPAHEPCVLARKPIEGTVANNVLKHGTGGLNIDGTRVGTEQVEQGREGRQVADSTSYHNGLQPTERTIATGRFPANLIHDGSDEVEAVFPNESSRFFYTAKASRSQRNSGLDSIRLVNIEYEVWKTDTEKQVQKVQLLVAMEASTQKVTGVCGTEYKNGKEWNTLWFGSDIMEKYQKDIKSIIPTTTSSITTSQILDWLTLLLTKEYTADVSYEMENGGSPVASAENCNTLITTINEKMVSALGVKSVVSGTQLRISVKDGSNFHSTVKPLSLTKYLATLIKPPTGGRLLVPFSGSGSEMIGALQAGWEFVQGVELTEEYIPIAEARIKYWLEQEAKKQPTLL